MAGATSTAPCKTSAKLITLCVHRGIRAREWRAIQEPALGAVIYGAVRVRIKVLSPGLRIEALLVSDGQVSLLTAFVCLEEDEARTYG